MIFNGGSEAFCNPINVGSQATFHDFFDSAEVGAISLKTSQIHGGKFFTGKIGEFSKSEGVSLGGVGIVSLDFLKVLGENGKSVSVGFSI